MSVGWPYSPTSPLARLSRSNNSPTSSLPKSLPRNPSFPSTSFDTLVGQMEQQQSILDSLLHLSQPNDEGWMRMSNLRLNLVQVDLERCKWLLSRWFGVGLDLLQKYAAFVAGRGWRGRSSTRARWRRQRVSSSHPHGRERERERERDDTDKMFGTGGHRFWQLKQTISTRQYWGICRNSCTSWTRVSQPMMVVPAGRSAAE